jgi:hypothetical protein
MRVLVLLVCVALAIVLATVAPSRGDGESTESPPVPDSSGEPITGTPAEPLPGPREPRHEPFTPYSIGGPQAAWTYEQLKPEEKVVADRGLNEDQSAVQDAYAAASAALAANAAADRAALQLGVDESLQETGVVP